MPKQHEPSHSQPDRRQFVAAGAGLTVAGLAALASIDQLFADEPKSTADLPPEKRIIEPGATILFQGDSITDAGRNRDTAAEANSFGAMGNGYAWLVAAQGFAGAGFDARSEQRIAAPTSCGGPGQFR